MKNTYKTANQRLKKFLYLVGYEYESSFNAEEQETFTFNFTDIGLFNEALTFYRKMRSINK